MNTILVGLIGYTVADLVWRAVPADSTPPPPSSVQTRQNTASGGSSTGEQLASMHLLGRAASLNNTSSPEIPVDAPETRLNLSLRGLLYSARQADALAIIGEGSNGREGFYGVGDSLPGGPSIQAIHADRVVLMRNGRHEILTLPVERLDMVADASAPETAGLNDSPETIRNQAGATGGLGETRRELLRNPASFSQYVQIDSHTENGAFMGFRLRPGQDASLMEQSGLEPGDVVVSIDGNALNTPEAGLLALQQAAEAVSVELEVIRNGTPQTIHLDLSN